MAEGVGQLYDQASTGNYDIASAQKAIKQIQENIPSLAPDVPSKPVFDPSINEHDQSSVNTDHIVGVIAPDTTTPER
jgi:hypothetical protein